MTAKPTTKELAVKAAAGATEIADHIDSQLKTVRITGLDKRNCAVRLDIKTAAWLVEVLRGVDMTLKGYTEKQNAEVTALTVLAIERLSLVELLYLWLAKRIEKWSSK